MDFGENPYFQYDIDASLGDLLCGFGHECSTNRKLDVRADTGEDPPVTFLGRRVDRTLKIPLQHSERLPATTGQEHILHSASTAFAALNAHREPALSKPAPALPPNHRLHDSKGILFAHVPRRGSHSTMNQIHHPTSPAQLSPLFIHQWSSGLVLPRNIRDNRHKLDAALERARSGQPYQKPIRKELEVPPFVVHHPTGFIRNADLSPGHLTTNLGT